MNKWVANALGVAGIAALCAVGWAFVQWGKAAPPDLAPTIAKVNSLIDLIQRPCASVDAKGKLLPDGPICEIDTMIHDVRKITTSSGEQVKQTGQLISASTQVMTTAAHNLDTVGKAVQTASEHASTTADAATGAIAQVQIDLISLNAPLKAITPVLLDVDDTVKDADAIMQENRPIVHQLAVNFNGMADSGNKMLITGNAVEQKLAKCTLDPTFGCVFKADAIFAAQMFGYAVR